MKVNSKLKVPKPKKLPCRKRRLRILHRARRKVKAPVMKKPSGVNEVHEKRREILPFLKYKRKLFIDWKTLGAVALILLLIGAAVYFIWYYFKKNV